LLNKTDYYNTVKTVYYKQDVETGEWNAYDEEYEEWVEEGPRSYIGEPVAEEEEEALEAEEEALEAEEEALEVEEEEEPEAGYINEEASSENCSLFLSDYGDDETYELRPEASAIIENDAPLFIDPQMRVSTSSSAHGSTAQGRRHGSTVQGRRHGRSRQVDSRSPCRCDKNGCKECDCIKPRTRQYHAVSHYQDLQHSPGHRAESHRGVSHSHHAVNHYYHHADGCQVGGCHAEYSRAVHLVCSCARKEYHTHCSYCAGRTSPLSRRVAV